MRISPEKGWRYSLVLLARDIPHQVIFKDGHLEILVPEEFLAKAREELLAYEEENHAKPPKIESPPWEGVFWSFFLLTALLSFTFAPAWHSRLLSLGAGDSALIKQGQWWRVFTALFLHQDPAHLLGNMFFGALFMYFLRARLGLLEAWVYTLLSGGLGNFLNFYLRSEPHLAIGFSTAVFGELGLLAALSPTLDRKKGFLLSTGFLLAFLSFLGVSKGADLGAHLFGALVGFVLGLLVRQIKFKSFLPFFDKNS